MAAAISNMHVDAFILIINYNLPRENRLYLPSIRLDMKIFGSLTLIVMDKRAK